MLHLRLSLIGKSLHLNEIDWEKAHFVPNMQDYVDLKAEKERQLIEIVMVTYLTEKVTLWKALKVESPIAELLVDI